MSRVVPTSGQWMGQDQASLEKQLLTRLAPTPRIGPTSVRSAWFLIQCPADTEEAEEAEEEGPRRSVPVTHVEVLDGIFGS